MSKLHGAKSPSNLEDALSSVRDYLQRLKFGSVAITVHDGEVVQLDVTEKQRLVR